MSLRQILEDRLVDHRSLHGRRYALSSLILLVLVGFMSGCNSVRSIARFGALLDDDDFLRLGFKRRHHRPSQPTLCVQLQGLDTEALITLLSQSFVVKEEPPPSSDCPRLAIDGKRLRATRDTTDSSSVGIHILQIFSEQLAAPLQQRRLKSGENEITAMLDFLDDLELNGTTVTGDAIFAQKHICSKITAKGGEYLFPLKDNHRSVKAAMELSLRNAGGKNPQLHNV